MLDFFTGQKINVDYYYVNNRNFNFKPFQNVFKDVNNCVAAKYNYLQNGYRERFDLSLGGKVCNLNIESPTQYIFFYFTDAQNNLVSEKLFNSVILTYDGLDSCESKSYADIVFDTKKYNIIGLDDIYCFIIAKGNIHGKNNGAQNMSLINAIQMKFATAQNTQIKDTVHLNICSLSHNIIIYYAARAFNILHHEFQLCDSVKGMDEKNKDYKELSTTLDEYKLEFLKLKSSIKEMDNDIKLLKTEQIK